MHPSIIKVMHLSTD